MRMKKAMGILLSLLMAVSCLVVPAAAAQKPVLPKTARDSYGNQIAYEMKGKTLTIRQTKDAQVGDAMELALYPLLDTCLPSDRNVVLTLDYDPIAVFALSDLVRSGRVHKVDFCGRQYTFTVKNGQVSKMKIDGQDVDMKYSHGRLASYEWWYGLGADSAEVKYKNGDVVSGKVGDYYEPYDFTCTVKDGELSKVVKRGDTYKVDVSCLYKNGRIASVMSEGKEMYDFPFNKVTRYYYNTDGTLGSVDYHEVVYTQTGGAPEVDDVYFVYGY